MIWANQARVYGEEGGLADVTFDAGRLSALDAFWISPRKLFLREVTAFLNACLLLEWSKCSSFPQTRAGR